MLGVVRIDHREMQTHLSRHLKSVDFELEIIHLKNGDIEIGDAVLIERKCYSDLCSSIVDGRLFRQMHRLRAASPRPILLIEEDEGGMHAMHRNAILGALSSIAIDLGIPILQTSGPAESVALIEVIANREQNRSRRQYELLKKRLERMEEEYCTGNVSRYSAFQKSGCGSYLREKEGNCLRAVEDFIFNPQSSGIVEMEIRKFSQVELSILQSYPNIGPKRAKRLLSAFGSLSKVIKANQSTLVDAGLPPAVAGRMAMLNHQ